MRYWIWDDGLRQEISASHVPLVSQLISRLSDFRQNAAVTHEKPLTIAAVGAGGKTSLIFQLMRECRHAGKRVLVTTTTHMFLPKDNLAPQVSPSGEDGAVPPAVLNPVLPNTIFLGIPVSPEIRSRKRSDFIKCGAPAPEAMQAYGRSCAVILVEADGSRRLPMKIPDIQEPVIPPETDIILAVCGLSSLKHPLSRVCQRWELLKREDTEVTPFLLASLMKQCYLEPLKEKYPNACIIPVWNQADTPAMMAQAEETAALCGSMVQLITALAPAERNKL